MKVPKKILFVLHGAIGDVVRALPLATRIKAHWPETRIFWAIEPKSMDILVDHPAVDELLIFQRQLGFSEFRRLLRSVRKQQVDVTLDLQRHFKSGIVSYSSRAKRRIGFHLKDTKECNWLFNNASIPPFGDTISKISHYQKFGDALGLPPASPLDFGFRFSDEIVETSKQLLDMASRERAVPLPDKERRVALNVGASWGSKRWNVVNFVRTIRLIVDELAALPILLGGPGDRNFAEAILRELGEKECISLVGRTNLRQLTYVLSQVRVALSGDSGAMHPAAAVGTPVVSLWGPTDPSRTGPYEQEKFIVRSAIGCAPCYRRSCPGLGTLCMEDIPPDVVLHWVKEAGRTRHVEK